MRALPARLLGSIPSPSRNALHLGPFQLRAYGLAIAVGAIVAIRISERRWEKTGREGDISRIAMWAFVAGLLGARAYHVITDYRTFEGRWGHVFFIWEGGLGIPG